MSRAAPCVGYLNGFGQLHSVAVLGESFPKKSYFILNIKSLILHIWYHMTSSYWITFFFGGFFLSLYNSRLFSRFVVTHLLLSVLRLCIIFYFTLYSFAIVLLLRCNTSWNTFNGNMSVYRGTWGRWWSNQVARKLVEFIQTLSVTSEAVYAEIPLNSRKIIKSVPK